MKIPCRNCINLPLCLNRFNYVDGAADDSVYIDYDFSHCSIIMSYIDQYGYSNIINYYVNIKSYTGPKSKVEFQKAKTK
jgi:hypothetical protein